MNLYLHGITGVDSIVEAKDALLGAGGRTYDVILTNPPFGKKQSYKIVRDDGEIDSEREDYDGRTSSSRRPTSSSTSSSTS